MKRRRRDQSAQVAPNDILAAVAEVATGAGLNFTTVPRSFMLMIAPRAPLSIALSGSRAIYAARHSSS